MASKTQKTELQRLRKKKNQGRKRKNKTEILGSTKSQKELFQD
jgi:hypothetical protein